MDIILSNQSDFPLYEQIVQQIQQQIITGQILPASPLPSIRQLAKELQVSIITTKRAYEELESLGLVDTIVGKGTFVTATPTGQAKEAAIIHLEEKLQVLIAQGQAIGLTKADFMTMVNSLFD